MFCKQVTCPSSEALLSYGTIALTLDEEAQVKSHLAGCDFCGAELQLLIDHSPVDEEFDLPEIPLDLRCLAEALLCGHSMRMEGFLETSFEKEPLTLTDA
jgi:hypothetical protein